MIKKRFPRSFSLKNRRFFEPGGAEMSLILVAIILAFAWIIVMGNPSTSRQPSTSTVQPTLLANLPQDALVACDEKPADVMLVIDNSKSMTDELADAKAAAKLFVDQMSLNGQARVGVVVFNTQASQLSGLRADGGSVKSAIDSITLSQGSCVHCAIDAVIQEFAANGRGDARKVAILLTDGKADVVNGISVAPSNAETVAIEAVKNGFASHVIRYFTIGLGTDANAPFMRQIATETGGSYFAASRSSDLAGVYQGLAGISGKGSITGFAFDDANDNGAYDASEAKLQGWDIELQRADGFVTAQTKTNASGYRFAGVCPGNYAVAVRKQSGWTQTLPSHGGGQIAIVATNDTVAETNFGFSRSLGSALTNKPEATVTPKPGTPTKTPTPTAVNLPPVNQPLASDCPSSVNKHAFGYGRRLEVINPCVRIRGKVVRKIQSKDGDYNLNVIVDPEYRKYVSNAIELHTETICFTNKRIANSTASCAGYTSPSSLRPDLIPVGAYIEVVGPHVLDHTHGSGKEIHPVHSLKRLD